MIFTIFSVDYHFVFVMLDAASAILQKDTDLINVLKILCIRKSRLQSECDRNWWLISYGHLLCK